MYNANTRVYTVQLDGYSIPFSAEALSLSNKVERDVPFELVPSPAEPIGTLHSPVPDLFLGAEKFSFQTLTPFSWTISQELFDDALACAPSESPIKVANKKARAVTEDSVRTKFPGAHIEPNQNEDGTIGDTGRFL